MSSFDGVAISEQQRDRALAILQSAYADGRLDEAAFDFRMSKALAATNRRELNSSVIGLAVPPLALSAVAGHKDALAKQSSDVGIGLVHWSPLVSWVVGPAVVFGVAEKGSRIRAEAAKALNFNLLVTGVFLVGFAMPYAWLTALWVFGTALTWLITTLVMGARGVSGKQVSYPASFIRVFPTSVSPRKQLGR